jgi:hypothetical protein
MNTNQTILIESAAGSTSDAAVDRADILPPLDAARYVGLAPPTMSKMRCWGGGPEFLKLGRKVVYRRAALDEWLAARVARNTSDAARLPSRLADGSAQATKHLAGEVRRGS